MRAGHSMGRGHRKGSVRMWGWEGGDSKRGLPSAPRGRGRECQETWTWPWWARTQTPPGEGEQSVGGGPSLSTLRDSRLSKGVTMVGPRPE